MVFFKHGYSQETGKAKASQNTRCLDQNPAHGFQYLPLPESGPGYSNVRWPRVSSAPGTPPRLIVPLPPPASPHLVTLSFRKPTIFPAGLATEASPAGAGAGRAGSAADPAPSSALPLTPSRPAAQPYPDLDLSRRLAPRHPLLQVPRCDLRSCRQTTRQGRGRGAWMREGLTHTSLLQAPAASPRVPLPLAPSQSFVLPLTPAMLAICFQAGSESEGLLRSCF